MEKPLLQDCDLEIGKSIAATCMNLPNYYKMEKSYESHEA